MRLSITMLAMAACLRGTSASVPELLYVKLGQRQHMDLCRHSHAGPFKFHQPEFSGSSAITIDAKNNCAPVIYANSLGKVRIDVLDKDENLDSTILIIVEPENGNGQAFGQANQTNTTSNDAKRTPVETAFIVGVAVLLVLALFSLGCKLDDSIIWKNFRRPVNLLIGMVCQFLIMPLISFGLGKATKLGRTQAMALFACSISPGGGASNLYTEMFMGDVELSAVMTFVSSVAAFGTVPLWLLFMNRFILPRDQYTNSTSISSEVPLAEITRSLASLVIPLILGLLARKFLPRFAEKVAKVVRVLAVIFLIYVVVLGFIAYSRVFSNLDGKLVVSSISLPWIGFSIGGLASVLLRRKKEQAVAISLETGIQNTGIAIFVIERVLKSAEISKAMISPVFYALSTPIPIMICFGLRMIIEKVRNDKIKKRQTADVDYTSKEEAIPGEGAS